MSTFKAPGMTGCTRVVVITLAIFGFVCLLVGGVVFGVFPSIYEKKVEESLVLKINSEAAERFLSPPVAAKISYYFFNVTNTDDVNNINGTMPELQEVGPFVFMQKKTKEVSSWNSSEGTVSYFERTVYTFDAEASAPLDLSIQVNHANLPDIVLAYIFANPVFAAIFYREPPEGTIGGLVTTHSVGELLFDGYKIPYLDWFEQNFKGLYDSINAFMPGKLPKGNVFSLFQERNNTLSQEYTVHTGENGMDEYTIIDKYDNAESLSYWKQNTHCNDINGTDGTQFPPKLDDRDTLYVFSTDVCRSLMFKYDSEVVVEKIPARRYIVPAEVFADPNTSDDNKCYCKDPKDICPAAGVILLKYCRNDQPVAMSCPHFYLSDKIYQDAFQGLTPNQKDHGTFIDVEPITGTVIRGRKRLQVNVVTERIEKTITMKYADLGFFPVLWVEEGAEIDGPKAEEFREKVINPKKTAEWSLIAVMAVGAVVILLGIVIYCMKR